MGHQSRRSGRGCDMSGPLWRPDAARIAAAEMTAFMRAAAARWGVAPAGYGDLYRWSIDRPERFWTSVWDFCAVIGDRGSAVLEHGDRMPGARFFPGARLNFAENLLRRRDDGDALVFRGEARVERRLSHRQLYDLVSRLTQALRAAGIAPGDRGAGFVPNLPEAIAAALAAASLGAVWSSCSPDFGVQGVLDRFGQIAPRLLFTADGYRYAGEEFDCLARVREIVAAIPAIERVVVVPFLRDWPSATDLAGIRGAERWEDFAERDSGAGAPARVYERLPFDHPLYILYSSGTTGLPKCLVHGAGGTLLQHLKEHVLHTDVRPGERVFYATTC